MNAFPDLCAGSGVRNNTFFPTPGPAHAALVLPCFSESRFFGFFFFLETGKEGIHKLKRDYSKIINMSLGSKK